MALDPVTTIPENLFGSGRLEAHSGADPILEIAALAGQRRECGAGLDDQ